MWFVKISIWTNHTLQYICVAYMLFMWGSYCNFRFQILEISSLLYCSKCWKQTSSESKAKKYKFRRVLVFDGPCQKRPFCLFSSWFLKILVFLSSERCDSGDSPLKSTCFEYQFEIRTGNSKLWFSAAILRVQTSGQQQQQQPVKRKTWAESSILSGGVATALGSTYAQDYHQHTCPASKVHSQKRK